MKTAMNLNLNPYIEAVLAGSSISAESKRAGVWPEQLRVKLMAHPDYAKAKAEGRLKAPGFGKLMPIDRAAMDKAIADVVEGMTATDSAIKHNLAPSTLTKMFHRKYPDLDLPKGGSGGKRDQATRIENARATVKRCEEALAKALEKLSTLESA